MGGHTMIVCSGANFSNCHRCYHFRLPVSYNCHHRGLWRCRSFRRWRKSRRERATGRKCFCVERQTRDDRRNSPSTVRLVLLHFIKFTPVRGKGTDTRKRTLFSRDYKIVNQSPVSRKCVLASLAWLSIAGCWQSSLFGQSLNLVVKNEEWSA